MKELIVRGHTFGRCVFEVPQGIVEPDADVHFALLLFLATAGAEGAPRLEIIGTLWPDAAPDAAGHRLRQALYRLRGLGVPARVRGGRVATSTDAFECDLRSLLHGVLSRDEILRLATLPFLPAYAPKLGTTFAEWVDALRARVTNTLRRVLSDEISAARARGRYQDVGRLARALLVLDPLNEVGTLGLAECLALEGSKVEAIRMLEAYEQEVGAVSPDLRLPPRLLRKRVREQLHDAILPRSYELPLVGREREFADLCALYRAAAQGQAGVVLLTGEAGIGKTRLAKEILRTAALDGATILTYEASAGDTFTPLATLVALGRQMLGLPGALGSGPEHLQFIERLGHHDTASLWSVTGAAADMAYAQMVMSFAELTAAVTDEAPLVLFLDNAHRLHDTSWRLVVDVLERTSRKPLLLLLASRQLPSADAPLSQRSSTLAFHMLPVPPLAPAESLRFLEQWGARNSTSLPAAASAEFTRRAYGNPFYLHELASDAARRGDTQSIPRTIADLIEAQVAELPRAAQQVLLVSALLESWSTITRIDRVLELPAAELAEAFERAQKAGLIVVDAMQVRPKHDLVAELTVQRSQLGQRSFLRLRIAAALTDEFEASQELDLLGESARHYEAAGDVHRAHSTALRLGQQLMREGLGEEASSAFAKAAANARTNGESLAAVEGQLRSHRLAGHWGAIRRLHEERSRIKAQNPALGPTIDDLSLQAVEASIWSHEHNVDVNQLRSLAENRSLPTEMRIRAAIFAAIIADTSYEPSLVADVYSTVADLAETTSGQPDRLVLELILYASVGDPRQLASIGALLIEHARAHAEHAFRIQTLRRVGSAYCRTGYADAAIPVLQEALELAEAYELPLQAFSTREALTYSLLVCGHIDSARKHLDLMICCREADDDLFFRNMKRSLAVLVAWYLRDPDLLRSRNIPAHVSLPHPNRVGEHDAEACNLASLLLTESSAVPSSEALESLERHHHAGKAYGGQDFCSEVLFAALERIGQHERAIALREDYYSYHRRERLRSLP